MTSEHCPAAARVRAAEILLDRGWGKSIERHATENGEGQRLTKIVHEFVHLDPQPRQELEQQELVVEWKDVTNGGGRAN
jgi:hypothetical protein